MNDMTHANYTHGFSGGVTIRGMPVLNSYGGNVYWVDSAGSANGAGTFQRPFLTIDAAVGNCTANNGDFIMVKPGHAETVSAAAGLDLDIAGITIIFLGNDTDRGTITFNTDVLADMDVDAANITMIGPRFVMGLDNVTAPIDVNSAGFKLLGSVLEDAAAMAPPDWIVADANADDMTIDGLLYRESTTGTQNQSLIQIAAATRPTLRNIRATGDFATGIIENGTAWIDATLENLVLDNSNSSPTVCVLLQAGSTGWFRNSALRVSSGSTGYTAANAMQISPDVVVTGTDGNVAADPTIGNLEDAAATGAVTTTDTLTAYIKQLVTQMGVEADTDPVSAVLSGAGGITTWKSGAAPNTGISISEVLRYISENLGAVDTTAATGAVTATDSAMAYLKQLVTTVGIEADTDPISAVLSGAGGITTWKAAAAAGTGVSMSEVLRYVSDIQLPIRTAFAKADVTAATAWSTANSPVTVATVTGVVMCRVFGHVTTAITSTAGTGTLALGVSDNTALWIAATTADATNFALNDVWVGPTTTTKGNLFNNTSGWALVSNDTIKVTIATNNMTAGGMTIYVEWMPVSSGATVA